MKKPTPKVAVVSNSEAYWVSEGKNSREMTTVRKPKMIKSYHSRAFPITAAATWRVFGADRPAVFISIPPETAATQCSPLRSLRVQMGAHKRVSVDFREGRPPRARTLALDIHGTAARPIDCKLHPFP